MTIVKEFRVCVPCTAKEYEKGFRYTVARMCQMEALEGKGAGVVVLENRPVHHPELGHGRLTRSDFHVLNRVPEWLRSLMPSSECVVREECFNCFPQIHTEILFPLFSNFKISVRSVHLDNDRGDSHNVHALRPDVLAMRQVEQIDIAAPAQDSLHSTEANIATFVSSKTGRAPLKQGWLQNATDDTPVMCVYKLVTIDFPYFPLQSPVEGVLCQYQRTLIQSANVLLFTSIDDWGHMSIEEVESFEAAAFAHSTALSQPDGKEGAAAAVSEGALSEGSTLDQDTSLSPISISSLAPVGGCESNAGK